MIILLDTTEFYDSLCADSAAFRLLEDFCDRTVARLVVPEVVIMEAANHARKAAAEANKAIRDAKRQYARLPFMQVPGFPEPMSEEEAARSCEKRLRQELQHRFHAQVLPLPDCSLTSLLDRSLRQHRPFSKGKDGLRDTLIWLSILEFMRSAADEYVFITGNERDFPENPTAEFGDAMKGRRLTFVKDINSFLEAHKGELNTLEKMTHQIRKTKKLADVNLEDELSDLSSDTLVAISSSLQIKRDSLREVEEPYWISVYEAPEDIKIDGVYGLPNELIVKCSAVYLCTVEGYVPQSDAIDSDAFTVTDFAWNERYAEVEFSLNLRVHFLITLRSVAEGSKLEDGEHYKATAIEVVEVIDESDS